MEKKQSVRSEMKFIVLNLFADLTWEGRMDLVRIHTEMHVF